jgi:hypothetical protein
MSDSLVGSDVVAIAAPLASIVAQYAHRGARVPALKFASVADMPGFVPPPESAGWGGVQIADSGEAVLTLNTRRQESAKPFAGPVAVPLIDNSTLSADDAHVTGRQMSMSIGNPVTETTELRLFEWHWSTGEKPVAWIALLKGAKFPHASNLHIRGPNDEHSHRSLRLQGNVTWHLVRDGIAGKRTCVAVIDAGEKDLDRNQLWDDFAALEFVFGTPLRMDTIIGVNAKNEPIAAFGVSFGYRFRPDASGEPPLPNDPSRSWIAVAFPLVARALAAAPEPNPVAVATTAYVDSMMGHIDGQYLFAQVALEALAYRLTPTKKPIVKDVEAWQKWAKSLRADIEQHAVDKSAANILAVKLRDASRPTTSSLVQAVLRQASIEPPSEALDEIDGRNVVSHTFVMNDDQPYDLERDVRRVRMIRTLLAALVLRHVGYEGAVAGYDLDEQRSRKPADWFPVSEAAAGEANRTYLAAAGEDTTGGTPS